jgi:hypothetical protein
LPKGGIRLYLDGTGGFPKIGQGLGTAYGSATSFNSIDYSNTSHRYRFKADISGNLIVYIDGSQIGTFTMDAKFFGGFFGVWTNIAGAVKIDKVVFYS